MAYFNTNVDNMLRHDLEMAYEDMAYGGNYGAILGLFEKKDSSGSAVEIPVLDSNGPGGSATASVAYANSTLSARYKFVPTPFKTYGFVTVPLDQDIWTKGDNAVAELLLDESKNAMNKCKRDTDAALS